MNISATLNIFKLIQNPSLCLPHATVPTFNHLPIPVSKAFVNHEEEKAPDIRAVVLDKDNCFAIPKENSVYIPYEDKFKALRTAYPGSRLLIVSNSAGTKDDPGGREADLLEAATGVKVLRHSTKKPGCGPQILRYFQNAPDSGVKAANQIAVVGDRLFTDMMLASLMRSWSVWTKNGVVQEKNLFSGMESKFASLLYLQGFTASRPPEST